MLDYISFFNAFLTKTHYKILKLIKQFWTEEQYIDVYGSTVSPEARRYSPEKVNDIEFASVISSGELKSTILETETQMQNQWMMQGLISIEMLLQNGNIMGGDKLLQQFKSFREQLSEGKIPEGAPAWLVQEVMSVRQNVNPQDQQALAQLMQNGGNIQTPENSPTDTRMQNEIAQAQQLTDNNNQT